MNTSRSPSSESAGRPRLLGKIPVLALSLFFCGAPACRHGATSSIRPASPANASQPEGGWQTSLGRDHPLVDRIWDCRRRAFADGDAVEQRLRGARIVLLGE